MTQAAYTPEAWAQLTKNPQDRSQAVGAALQQLGGRLISLHHSFGDYDTVVIYEAPDQITATTYAMAVLAAGHVRASATTQLLTTQEAMEAMRRAGTVRLETPG
ncbi:MAG: GYD domain-containing protein [Chloroflexota bacterium]|nr:GYD domain-containing protein [Chloroflexota bacterium]